MWLGFPHTPRVGGFLHVDGQDVKATDGTTAAIRDVLPVPLGSGDVKFSREPKAGRPIRDEGARQALRPFAAVSGASWARWPPNAAASLRKAEGHTRLLRSHD